MVYQKKLNELTQVELLQIMQLRQTVFMIEQSIHEVDIDDDDLDALHCFIKREGKIVSYSRLIKHDDQLYVGRVCTAMTHRKQGFAAQIMKELQKQHDVLAVSAQIQVIPYYKKLGFQVVGNKYKEAGIWHQKMIWIA